MGGRFGVWGFVIFLFIILVLVYSFSAIRVLDIVLDVGVFGFRLDFDLWEKRVLGRGGFRF